MMRKLVVGLGAGLMLAAPAFGDTLEHVIGKGIVLKVEGMEIPVTYAEDGTYIADVFGMEIAGVWRIEDGNVLCTKAEVEPEETCAEYPAGKEPGDEFEMSGPAGVAVIQINE